MNQLKFNETKIFLTKGKIYQLEWIIKEEKKEVLDISNIFYDIIFEVEEIWKLIDLDNNFDINKILEDVDILKEKVILLKQLFLKITN
jgi:hypothetical protein